MFAVIPLDIDNVPHPEQAQHWVKLNQARNVAHTLACGAVIRRCDSDWSITVKPESIEQHVQDLRNAGLI